MAAIRTVLAICIHVLLAAALGMTVLPIKAGDTRKYSSKNHLWNCVAYDTVCEDVITVHVQAGEKIRGQQLNLHIFDSDDNQLRLVEDIDEETNVIFTNLNSDLSRHPKRNIIDKLSSFNRKNADDILHSNEGKSRIYVCFDNIYADKSWSFQPQPRDVVMTFAARDFATLRSTNYKLFTKYFQGYGPELDSTAITDLDFEELFLTMEMQLLSVIQNLESSEKTLQALLTQESKLRDANEQIFANYTKVSIAFLIIIAVFGLVPILYMRFYLKKINVI